MLDMDIDALLSEEDSCVIQLSSCFSRVRYGVLVAMVLASKERIGVSEIEGNCCRRRRLRAAWCEGGSTAN